MSRSILLSIMFIAGTLGVIAFSAAQFTDFETDTSDPITAGTIDLNFPASPNGQISCVVPADGLEGIPGGAATDYQATCDFTVVHTGSLENTDLYAQITVASIACSATGGLADGSEYCDAGADLTAGEFLVESASMGDQSVTPGDDQELSAYLASCSLLTGSMPVDTDYDGSITIELQQDRTTNAMQGDAITLQIDFELMEDGATDIDCSEDS